MSTESVRIQGYRELHIVLDVILHAKYLGQPQRRFLTDDCLATVAERVRSAFERCGRSIGVRGKHLGVEVGDSLWGQLVGMLECEEWLSRSEQKRHRLAATVLAPWERSREVREAFVVAMDQRCDLGGTQASEPAELEASTRGSKEQERLEETLDEPRSDSADDNVSRGFIQVTNKMIARVTGTRKLAEWIEAATTTDLGEKPFTAGHYLVDFLEDRGGASELLRRSFSNIMAAELSLFGLERSKWPDVNDYEEFREFFDVECFALDGDVGEVPLQIRRTV